VLADLAIQRLRAVHVPLHAALAAPQAAELIAHCGAAVTLVRDAALADRIAPLVPAGTRVVLHADIPQSGAAQVSRAVPQADELATILYTSGTTGAPLGVMLSQQNIVSNAVAMTIAAVPSSDEIRLCLLPLSHIYARTCDLTLWSTADAWCWPNRERRFRDCQLAAPNQ
jgi:long-chain acyl-CoA synthetase